MIDFSILSFRVKIDGYVF